MNAKKVSQVSGSTEHFVEVYCNFMITATNPMRRLSRLDRSLDRLWPRTAVSSSLFLCSACLRQAPFSTSVRHLADTDNVPRTERLRRKIWGTNEPPGSKDPYRGPTIAEEREAARAVEDPPPSEEAAVEGSITQKPTRTATLLDASYEPANTWDGLEEVGNLPAPEFYFEGFLPAERFTDPYQTTAALHRAAVEVFTLKQAGRPLSELSKSGRRIDNTRDVQILISHSDLSSPSLQFPEDSPKEMILESLAALEQVSGIVEATEAVDSVFQIEALDGASVEGSDTTKNLPTQDRQIESIEAPQLVDYKLQVASWDPSWLQVSLEDSEVKFAIIKRVMQLTGIRVADSAINSAQSLRSLLNQITQKPKPAKLFDALNQRNELVNLPNVNLHKWRITPSDREKRVGRWKIIEKELISRGLPLPGHS